MRLMAIAHSLDSARRYNVVCRPKSGGIEPVYLRNAQLRQSSQQVHLVCGGKIRRSIGAGTFIEHICEHSPAEALATE